ncbi:50S ribosomal subunit L30 [Auriscalpium vulgare]|uniref:50S ribosomal subunit L30 n=1 Tax=Auriscalpium vulgare TaxID=40419 RepID=A0ACB8RX86_9AGAM|nr:50S ribosomal subunit L30 [Auriscalpium vulgare]
MSCRTWLSSCRQHGRAASARCRTLATEAAPAQSTSASPPSSVPRPKKPPRAILRTAVILNRAPILTRTPTLFERAYYAYQARLQRALHNPFPYEFYFKPGSLLESKFNLEERRRDRKAFGPGFGADSPDAPGAGVTADDLKKFGQEEEDNTVSRVHASDLNNDVQSLDRKGQRNLYLLLRRREGAEDAWKFPEGPAEQGELLHKAAERDLRSTCGEGMDTWIVSRKPIGLYETRSSVPPTDPTKPPKTCVFFFKAHILAGQVQPLNEAVLDFAWLTKEEIQTRVGEQYWDGVKDMLSGF